MSSLIVEVCTIDNIKPHPDPETINLEIATVKGWDCIVGKGTYQTGNKIVYIPIDSMIPLEWSEKWNITKYLHKGRVKSLKLRGFISCGLIVACEDLQWVVGQDVSEFYGITKWEPQELTSTKSENERDNPKFIKYTDIENFNNFPDIFDENELVIFTEKIHGTNSRVGFIDGNFIAGSHNCNKRLDIPIPKNKITNTIFNFIGNKIFGKDIIKKNYDYLNTSQSLYWYPLTQSNIRNMLLYLNEIYNKKTIILFGEIYGNIQDLKYGLDKQYDFIAFDLYVEDHYLDFETFQLYCSMFNIPIVPVIYNGKFSKEKVFEYRQGQSTIASHIREGIVIKPYHETIFSNHRCQKRKVLKAINPMYIDRKKGTEYK